MLPPNTSLRLTPFALACALLCGAAHAEPDAPEAAEPEQKMQTVVVEGTTENGYKVNNSNSSTRLNLSLRETPQAVSVVTRAMMDDFRLDSVNEMLTNTAGVTVERIETDRTYYTSRGFDITNFQYDGVGIPFVYGNVYGNLDTSLYERIDIVRGANGLMSGVGNPSATVNFIRKRPTQALQASAALTYGTWGKKRFDGDVSGSLNESGTVKGRVVAAYEDSDSYLDRYSNNRKVLYGVIEADLTPDTKLTAGHTAQIGKVDGALWGALPLYYTDLTPTDYDVGTSTATDWAYTRNEYQQTFVELTQRLGQGWTAQATLSRNTFKTRGKMFYVYGTPDRTTGLGLFAYPSRYDADNKQTLFDAAVNGEFSLGGRKHELSFGANWSKSTLDDISYYGRGIGDPLPALETWGGAFPEPAFDASIDGSSYTDKRKSIFGVARFNLTDPLKLITGFTTTKAESSGLSYGVTKYRSATKTTPYLGLTYDILPNLTAYGSYSEIFSPQSETDITGGTLAPMEGKNSELGLKGDWFNRRLNTSAAIFRTKQTNVAEQAGINGTKAYYRGINADSKGFELEASGELTKGWQTSANFTVLSIDGDDGMAARTYLPRRLFRLSTTYRLPTLPLTVGLGAKWQDDIYRNEADGAVIRQASYAVLGLMARYDINRQLSLAVNVNNVADKKYLTSLYWSQSYYAAPRNASVTLNWKY